MKAMVFAAGLGTRLGEISRTTPKCLVQAGGRAMIDHVLERLARAGVTEAVVNLHHLGHRIEEHFAASRPPVKVVYSREVTELLGTGGGLKFARALLGGSEEIIVHNADIYSELDLSRLVAAHRAGTGAIATLAVMERPTARCLLFDAQGRLCGWDNADTGQSEVLTGSTPAQRLAFSGIQVISPDLFQFMEGESGSFSIIRAYLNAARAGRPVQAFRMDGEYWIDVGTPQKLQELQRRLESVRLPT